MALKKENWERDVVYLFQFPRAACVPSVSPFCLKLETFLRIADITYENVDAGFMAKSKKGQLPFVEVNGQEIDDSHFAASQLIEVFHKEDMESHLGDEDRAHARAYNDLVEGSLFWVMIYQRSSRAKDMMGDEVFGKNMGQAMKLARPLFAWRFGSMLKGKAYQQGIGRHSPEEVQQLGEQDLKALSTFLGKKKFVLGEKPTRLDATVFGHVAQLWYTPMHPEMKKFMGSECSNLVEYLERIKSTYWPDWDKACGELLMNTKNKAEQENKGEEEKIKDAASATTATDA